MEAMEVLVGKHLRLGKKLAMAAPCHDGNSVSSNPKPSFQVGFKLNSAESGQGIS